MVADRASMHYTLNTLADFTSCGQAGLLGDILRRNDRATNFGEASTQSREAQKMRKLSIVAVKAQSEESTTLVAAADDVGRDPADERAVEIMAMAETLPSIYAMVAGVGSWYDSEPYLGGFSSTIENKDFNDEGSVDDRRYSKQEEHVKVMNEGDGTCFDMSTMNRASKRKGERVVKNDHNDEALKVSEAINDQAASGWKPVSLQQQKTKRLRQ